jgi:hypothetical protein
MISNKTLLKKNQIPTNKKKGEAAGSIKNMKEQVTIKGKIDLDQIV